MSPIKKLLTSVCASFVIVAGHAYANETYTVKKTDSLTAIINKHYKDTGLNKAQIMVALLAENPSAFNLGNINSLKVGETLVLPAASGLKAMPANKAIQLITKHNAAIKQAKPKRMAAPFADYTPTKAEAIDLNALLAKQKEKESELEMVEKERAELVARVDKLMSEKDSKDTELESLEEKLKELQNN